MKGGGVVYGGITEGFGGGEGVCEGVDCEENDGEEVHRLVALIST